MKNFNQIVSKLFLRRPATTNDLVSHTWASHRETTLWLQTTQFATLQSRKAHIDANFVDFVECRRKPFRKKQPFTHSPYGETHIHDFPGWNRKMHFLHSVFGITADRV